MLKLLKNNVEICAVLKEIEDFRKSVLYSEKQIRAKNKKLQKLTEKEFTKHLRTVLTANKWEYWEDEILAIDKVKYSFTATLRSMDDDKYSARCQIPKEIKSLRDLRYYADELGVYHMQYKNCLIDISRSNRIQISSSKSKDTVMSFLKEFSVPIDLSSSLTEIVRLEAELESRRSLMKAMSTAMLFTAGK